MFEAITIGVMLHSYHLESPDFSQYRERAYARSGVILCSEKWLCAPPAPDSGEVFTYNNATRGAYAIADGWTVAVFKNSYSRLSVFGGYTFSKDTRLGEFSATVGVSTGYKTEVRTWVRDGYRYTYEIGSTRGTLVPVGMLSYATPKLPDTDARVRLMYTPRKEVLTLGVEKKF